MTGGSLCTDDWHLSDEDRSLVTEVERRLAVGGQVGGSHYQGVSLQPLDVIRAWGLDFVAGNVVKYLFRAGRKNGYAGGIQDIDKAIHYLQIMRADFVTMDGGPR